MRTVYGPTVVAPCPVCGYSIRVEKGSKPAWPPWWLPRQRYALQQGTPPAARRGRQERPGCAHRSEVQPQEALAQSYCRASRSQVGR